MTLLNDFEQFYLLPGAATTEGTWQGWKLDMAKDEDGIHCRLFHKGMDVEVTATFPIIHVATTRALIRKWIERTVEEHGQ